MWTRSLTIFLFLTLVLGQAYGESTANETTDYDMRFVLNNVTSFQTSMSHLTVLDVLRRDSVNNNTILSRRIINGDAPDIIITEVQLISPENITVDDLGTTKLSVDYSKLITPLKSVIASPFAVGSLLPSKDAPSQVLIVGLGGGQMNNFLHFTFPKMNITGVELEPEMVRIAEEYFGLKEDNYHKILAMDGIKYIEDAAKRKQKFDTVFLDACPSVYPPERVIYCPDEGFITDKTIQNIKDILTEHGSLAIKMLLNTEQPLAKAEEIENRFVKSHFKCSVMPMVHPHNRVLICGNDGVTKEEIEPKSIEKAMQDFYVQFNLTDSAI